MHLDRRSMLWRCLGLLGIGRGIAAPDWLRASPAAEYVRLLEPVVLPLGGITEPWQPLPFDAMAPSPRPGVGYRGRVALKGILLRLPAELEVPRVQAFCLTCPHEICQVDYVRDTEYVRVEEGEKPDHPLFACPCHFSVFDPVAGGERISGPSPRGLYRFRLEAEPEDVRIEEVEAAALR